MDWEVIWAASALAEAEPAVRYSARRSTPAARFVRRQSHPERQRDRASHG